jgi:arylsulfatase A-like enzyme
MLNQKPNVVFVFSDQHRAEAVGYEGNPDVLTPNLDRLAAESLVFKTAFKQAGYDTAYIGKWHIDGHLSWGPPHNPRSRKKE